MVRFSERCRCRPSVIGRLKPGVSAQQALAELNTLEAGIATRIPDGIIAGSIRRVVWSLNPDTVVNDVRTMENVVSDSVAGRRFQALLTTLFAGCAMLLACLGSYGVVSWSVSRRRAEIGLRMALGAASGRVRRMVVWQGMQPVLAGLGIGVVAAMAMGRMLGSLLVGVSAHDPLTIGGVAMTLAGVAALACYLPARRATLADPLRALRYE